MLTEIQKIKDFDNNKDRDLHLKQLLENTTFRKICELTFNKQYKFGISVNQAAKYVNKRSEVRSLFSIIEQLHEAAVSGDLNKDLVIDCLTHSGNETYEILMHILKRDLGVGINKKTLGKLGVKFFSVPYMRCSIWPAVNNKIVDKGYLIQQKMDGMYICIVRANGQTFLFTRSGQKIGNQKFTNCEIFDKLPNGMYCGEAIVSELERASTNGLMNSHESVTATFHVWDHVHCTFNGTINIDDDRIYYDRFKNLTSIVKSLGRSDFVMVPSVPGNKIDIDKIYQLVLQKGGEGVVIKELDMKYKNGTSNKQFKYKKVGTLEMRVTGYFGGEVLTRRENQVAGIIFKSDDGKIEGRCSGLTDAESEYFTKHQDTGIIIEVMANDITKAENKETYALNHPRFIKIREDKSETDTLEKAFEIFYKK